MTDNPDETARLIYLVVLGAMLIGYFASDFRHKLNQNLQMAAIWLLIFMAAIAAYSFRDVIGGEIFRATPVAGAEGGIGIRRSEDGHFYMVLQANGQNIEFVVDTGASDIVLTQDDARMAGINMAALSFSGEASTANGIVPIADARLDSLNVPGFFLNNVLVSVNGGDLDRSLLGMTYLNRFSKIAIEGERMVLTP